MAKSPENHIISALDIGTSKVVALIAEINEQDEIEIISIGSQPSKGLKKGVIINIDETVNAIQKAVSDAEEMAGRQIDQACVGIAGNHIKSFDSHGVAGIEHSEVSPSDVGKVIDGAKAVAMPADQRILHILPQEFVIDGQGDVKEPIGMTGVRLEANVHIITGSVSAIQNIVKCVNNCGIDVSAIVLEQLAASYAVLTNDEKELGVCVIDLGGGTTNVAVFTQGSIQYTFVIPVAGYQVTSDIAHAFRTPVDEAENIKLQYGCALTKKTKADDTIEIQGIAGRPPRKIPLQTLSGVIEARYEELLSMVYQKLEDNNLLDQLGSGIVITGGSSKIYGMVELTEEVFRIPVRYGSAFNESGLKDVIHNPMHATGVGLLKYFHEQQKEQHNYITAYNKGKQSIWSRMKEWLSQHF